MDDELCILGITSFCKGGLNPLYKLEKINHDEFKKSILFSTNLVSKTEQNADLVRGLHHNLVHVYLTQSMEINISIFLWQNKNYIQSLSKSNN